ncbi:DNA alkylation repair protein [Arthrobacter crystallopoietes]|uniref:DNA alkylation repair enzyme n=1 Tax=Crystallibacter crystallopoietes TaxID=37928 RepID=A0A1H1BW05_9MICC|nr:DNA alkylation repair protein [Arthrobacter crystallopoietes]AUI50991.1 DNA alkylation repair protein [Arthrobacter crystallopoietes]SDQ56114.1 DNA alkylation repair enzyme [Arthrobacter crystallopoietes]
MSDAAEFVDAALQRESSWERAEAWEAQLGNGLSYYGASVGAVRGTIRDAGRRYPKLSHDEITALSSELWAVPVFERRLAAVVLLQSNLRLLDNSDLTRLEGFVRSARLRALVDPLAVDVVGPMVERLDAPLRVRADAVLDRWAEDDDVWLRRAVVLSPLRALRKGGGDWDRFVRRAKILLEQSEGAGAEGDVVREAVALVLAEVAKTRPELQLPP